MRWALALLMLAGCANRLPDAAEPASQSAKDAIVQAWEDSADLPTAQTRACARDLDAVRIVAAADDRTFERHSAICAPGQCPSERCAYGCGAEYTERDCWGGWLRSGAEIGCDHRTPLVVIHESADVCNMELHGLAHVLAQCAMGGDRHHESDAVWGPGGVLDRAGGSPVR